MLPLSLKPALDAQLITARATHQRDLADGWGCVQLPGALARKYPNAPADWRWQWVFPQQRRHHVHETIIQRAMKEAVRRAGIAKHASCHTLP